MILKETVFENVMLGYALKSYLLSVSHGNTLNLTDFKVNIFYKIKKVVSIKNKKVS